MKRITAVLVALVALATMAAPAQASTTIDYDPEDATSIASNAAYLGYSETAYVAAAVEVHYFLLAISGKVGTRDCSIELGELPNGEFHYTYPQGSDASVAVADHRCWSEETAAYASVALLTFLTGLNAASNGATIPIVAPVPQELFVPEVNPRAPEAAAVPVCEFGEFWHSGSSNHSGVMFSGACDAYSPGLSIELTAACADRSHGMMWDAFMPDVVSVKNFYEDDSPVGAMIGQALTVQCGAETTASPETPPQPELTPTPPAIDEVDENGCTRFEWHVTGRGCANVEHCPSFVADNPWDTNPDLEHSDPLALAWTGHLLYTKSCAAASAF